MEDKSMALREDLARWLAVAEKQVAEADRYIVRQRAAVAELDSRGRDATTARNMLARLEDAQGRRLYRRDFLKRELELNAPMP
jgi:hypothetical protein